jgi:hypothetical protein
MKKEIFLASFMLVKKEVVSKSQRYGSGDLYLHKKCHGSPTLPDPKHCLNPPPPPPGFYQCCDPDPDPSIIKQI